MMGEIERICREMCADRGLDPDDVPTTWGPPPPGLKRLPNWRLYEPSVREVATKLRTPSKTMLDACWEVTADATWEKMIDVVLGNGDER